MSKLLIFLPAMAALPALGDAPTMPDRPDPALQRFDFAAAPASTCYFIRNVIQPLAEAGQPRFIPLQGVLRQSPAVVQRAAPFRDCVPGAPAVKARLRRAAR